MFRFLPFIALLIAPGPALAQAAASTAAVPSAAGAGNTLVPVAPIGPPPVARHAWTPMAGGSDIVAALKAAGRFQHLLRFIGRSGLKRELKKPGVTLLAPSDTAFAALGPERIEALMKDRKALRRLVAFHILPTRIDAAAARSLRTPAPTVEGRGVRFDLYRDRLGVGDAVILQADGAAGDNLIHVIDKVLEPPPPAG